MTVQPSSRTERVLIERLESRRLLSAGIVGQPSWGFHWFDRTGGPSAPSALFHRESSFDHDNSSSDAGAGALALIIVPDGHTVGFAPMFFGAHPLAESTYGWAPGFHWTGHDAGHDAGGEPGLGPSPMLHTPRADYGQTTEEGGRDSTPSEPSSTPDASQSLGQVTAGAGSSVVVVVVTQGQTPQLRVITIPVEIKNQPRVSPEVQPSASVPQTVPAQGAVESAVSGGPVIEHSSGVSTNPFTSAAAVSVLPPLKSAAFSAATRAVIEATAVARGAAVSEVAPVQVEGGSVKSAGLMAAVASVPAAEASQIAIAAPGPAAAVGAIRVATGWVRSAAAVIGRAFDAPAAVSDVQSVYVTPVAYSFLRISPAMLFNDTVGRMIRESASLSPAAASPKHIRAWAITGAVVAADAILVGSWHVNRRRKLRKAQRQSQWVARRGFGVAATR